MFSMLPASRSQMPTARWLSRTMQFEKTTLRTSFTVSVPIFRAVERVVRMQLPTTMFSLGP